MPSDTWLHPLWSVCGQTLLELPLVVLEGGLPSLLAVAPALMLLLHRSWWMALTGMMTAFYVPVAVIYVHEVVTKSHVLNALFWPIGAFGLVWLLLYATLAWRIGKAGWAQEWQHVRGLPSLPGRWWRAWCQQAARERAEREAKAEAYRVAIAKLDAEEAEQRRKDEETRQRLAVQRRQEEEARVAKAERVRAVQEAQGQMPLPLEGWQQRELAPYAPPPMEAVKPMAGFYTEMLPNGQGGWFVVPRGWAYRLKVVGDCFAVSGKGLKFAVVLAMIVYSGSILNYIGERIGEQVAPLASGAARGAGQAVMRDAIQSLEQFFK